MDERDDRWVPCQCPRCRKRYDALVRMPHGLRRVGNRYKLVCWSCTCRKAGPTLSAALAQCAARGADRERSPKCEPLSKRTLYD